MPVIFQQGASGANVMATTTVAAILNCVSQDVRQVLNPNAGITQATDAALLIDYVNRISLQMLRFSNWTFTLSAPQLLITTPGCTDYWIGPVGTAAVGTIDTQLNLTNVRSIKRDMVFNRTEGKALAHTDDPPLHIQLQQNQPPRFWRNDLSTPYVLNIYPPSSNNVPNTPPIAPEGPIFSLAAGGALPLRTYYLKTTFQDNALGESGASVEQLVVVPAGQLLTVMSPAIIIGGSSPIVSVSTALGPTINQWNIYAAGVTGAVDQAAPSNNNESLQLAGIPIGTNWTEPGTGLTTSGRQVPQSPTISLLGGFIIEFRYWQIRQTLTTVGQVLSIPDQYKDIVCAGVNWLAYKYLKKDDEAQIWKAVYERGLVEMVKDANLAPRDGEYVRPDPQTVVRSMNTGIGLDSGMETSIP